MNLGFRCRQNSLRMPGVILLLIHRGYTKPMNIPQELATLNLPPNSFVVVGSGILNALGIRESNDIDLIVTPEVFASLEQRGYAESSWPDQKTLAFNEFEFGTQWFGKAKAPARKTSAIAH